MKINLRKFSHLLSILGVLIINPSIALTAALTQLRHNAWTSIAFAVFIFATALSYQRLNNTGDISNYLNQYYYACANTGFTTYQLFYPIWYASLKLFCHSSLGFTLWSAFFVSIGYLFLALNVSFIARQSVRSQRNTSILLLVIIASFAAYSLPFLMTSFRTFVCFNISAYVIFHEIYKVKMNHLTKALCILCVCGLHPFPGIILTIFYFIFQFSLLRILGILAGLTIILLVLPGFNDLILSKVDVYIIGEYQNWNLAKNSELYKFLIVLFRKCTIFILIGLYLIKYRSHKDLSFNYIVFLIILIFISFFSRTFEQRIFYDAFVLFFPLFFIFLNSTKSTYMWFSVIMFVMCFDLRWFSIQNSAYSFEPLLFLIPLMEVLYYT